jgi:hypothetical protein
MLTRPTVSSIVKRQRFNMEAIQTVLMSLSYIGLLMLFMVFVSLVMSFPVKW